MFVESQVNLVFSIQSLKALEVTWIKDIQSNLKDALLILVGNKADIDDSQKHRYKRQVTQDEAHEFMQRHGLNHFTEVSARTGYGIKELVDFISKSIYHKNRDCLSEYRESDTASQYSYGVGGDRKISHLNGGPPMLTGSSSGLYLNTLNSNSGGLAG